MCSKPFRPGGAVEFGCGQCMACRLNRLRLWQGRLLLESTQHSVSLFSTLTYSPENLPAGGNLVPRDLQLFLKRLRARVPQPIRFFAVGEYGDKTWRPHYHLALFGQLDSEVVQSSWSLGFSHSGTLTPQSAGYLTRYTLKRMCAGGDPRLEGRHPEFVRMSLRPGIGRLALGKMADGLTDRKGAALVAAKGDVPTEFIASGKRYSLGRYLSRSLRVELGHSPAQPSSVSLSRSAERLKQDPRKRESVRKHHQNVAEQRVRSRRTKGDL